MIPTVSTDVTECYSDLIERAAKAPERCTIEAFQPWPGHILVRPMDPKAQTPGGLFIPDTWQKKQAFGVVLRTPKHLMFNSTDEASLGLAPGDVVMFQHSAGFEVGIGEEKLLVLTTGGQEASEVLGRWPAEIFLDKP